MAFYELLDLLHNWMKTQLFTKKIKNVTYEDPYTKEPKRRTFVRIFDLTKSRAGLKVKQSAKKLGINWQSGLSPFRKWSISRMEDLKVLTEKQMDRRYGNTKKIRDSHYYKDLNLNEKEGRTAINQIDRKSTRLNSSHGYISYAVFCLKKKNELQSRLQLVCRLLLEKKKKTKKRQRKETREGTLPNKANHSNRPTRDSTVPSDSSQRAVSVLTLYN